jgi:signal transduction histidine kinase
MLTLSPGNIQDRLISLHKIAPGILEDTALDSLLKRIASTICEVVSAQFSTIVIFGDGGKLEYTVPGGIGKSPFEKMGTRRPWKTVVDSLRSRQTILIADCSLEPQLFGINGKYPKINTLLGIPIWHNDHQTGIIFAANKESDNSFSADDQQVLEILAPYAAAAVANAIMFTQVNQSIININHKNKNLGLLNDLATGLASSMDIDQILDKALTQVMDFQSLEAAEVFLRLEDSRTLKLVWHRAKNIERLWTQTKYKFGEGVIGRAAQTGFPAVYNFAEIKDPSLALNELPCFDKLLCFPLTGQRGVWGVFCAATCSTDPLDELSLRLLSSMSMWLGSVTENIRYNLQQRRFTVMEERERIGMDLHDGVIQSIYAVGLTLEHARLLLKDDPVHAGQRIEQAIADLNSAIRDIRSYILGLRPRQLLNENLMKGIQRLISEFRINTLVDVTLKGSWEDLVDIPEAQAVALFHICQEALANISKHAQAHQINVRLWTTTDRAYLELKDDGKGFNPNKIRMNLGHGLANMQTRAYNAGGDVEFLSNPGEGATIISWVPFVNEKYTYE